MQREIGQIQAELKNVLKARGLLYSDISKKMKISDSTLKRLLNGKDVSLSKLIEICHCIGIEFFELMQNSSRSKMEVFYFTKTQEEYLAKDLIHFKYFRFLILKKTQEEIQKILNLSANENLKILKGLEKVELIERWEYSKIKLLGNFPFKWSHEGPLEKMYKKHILEIVTNKVNYHGINIFNEEMKVGNIVTELLLSEESQKNFQKDLDELYERYKGIAKLQLKTATDKDSIFSFFSLSGQFSWWD